MVAKSQGHSDYIFRNVTLLVHFHGSSNGHAGGDGIYAVFVTEIIRLDQRGKVAYSTTRTQRRDGFIFRTFTLAFIGTIRHFC